MKELKPLTKEQRNNLTANTLRLSKAAQKGREAFSLEYDLMFPVQPGEDSPQPTTPPNTTGHRQTRPSDVEGGDK